MWEEKSSGSVSVGRALYALLCIMNKKGRESKRSVIIYHVLLSTE